MRTPEELLNNLEDCMDLGLTAKQRDTIAEAMKVWKWEMNQEKTLPIHPVIGYAPTKRDYFTAMAMQGLLAGRSEYEDPQSGLQTAVESADFIIDQLK